MEIKQVVVHIEATINLGNYENFKPAITVTAEMTQEEIDDGGILELANMGRKELAYALWDMAEADLNGYPWAEPDAADKANKRRAENNSAYYRWMVQLNPEAAEGLLTELVGNYWEKKRAEEAAAQDAANAAINAAAEAAAMEADTPQSEAPDGDEKHWIDQEVEDLEAPNQGFN